MDRFTDQLTVFGFADQLIVSSVDESKLKTQNPRPIANHESSATDSAGAHLRAVCYVGVDVSTPSMLAIGAPIAT